MANIEPIEILMRVVVVTLAAIVTSWCWLLWRLFTNQPILPEKPFVYRRTAIWHFGTILLVFLVFVSANLLIFVAYRQVVGLLPGAGVDKPTPLAHQMSLYGLQMVIMLMIVPWVVWKSSGARLADLGLSFDDWWRQVLCGVVATLIAAPPVYAIQAVAGQIWKPTEHPLKTMIDKEFSVGVGWLAFVTAVILAPMFEELVFRGLLQSWLVALLGRGGRALRMPWQKETDCGPPIEQAPVGDVWEAEPASQSPSGSAALQNPGQTRPPDRSGLAITFTSLLFASVHAPQWPAPIALFLLAMVIGTVYHRTGSLITAVCMHATFNGISTLMLFASVLLGNELKLEKVIERVSDEVRMPIKLGEQGTMGVIRSENAL